MLVFLRVRAHIRARHVLGHYAMQNRTPDPGTSDQVRRKVRWHTPELKRLDVDLTAGNHRNSNDPVTGQNQFLLS